MTKCKTTIIVRAPRKIVEEWRRNFPNINDSAIIGVMWNSSPLKLESRLRSRNEVTPLGFKKTTKK